MVAFLFDFRDSQKLLFVALSITELSSKYSCIFSYPPRRGKEKAALIAVESFIFIKDKSGQLY